MAKNCERCLKEIPQDYQNLLCDSCYKELEMFNMEIERQKREEKEMGNEAKIDELLTGVEIDATIGVKTPQEANTELPEPSYNKNGVWDKNYQENPQAEDKEQWSANVKQFQKSGRLLWPPQRMMYTYIKDFIRDTTMAHPQYPDFFWKPKIVDVGCGIGVGSNIMSQEAEFVWGIDKNENSVKFAQEAFERNKNGIYYSPQVTYDVFDIMEDTRETLQFDIVVAIEVIEHIYDTDKFLRTIISKFSKRNKDGSYGHPSGDTVFFISSPNRNHKNLSKAKPINPFHVRELTSQEMFYLLSQYFVNVQILNADGTPLEMDNAHTPILYKCSLPKV